MAEHKILILGATGFPAGVTAYAWDKLPANLNVADFDVVILNLAAFEDNEKLREGIALERLPSEDQFAQLIFSPSEVISIGSIDTELGGWRKLEVEGGGSAQDLEREWSSWWLPISLRVVPGSGEVRDSIESWESYFKQVGRYAWHFDHLESEVQVPRYSLERVHPKADRVTTDPHPLAWTRFGKAVAIQVGLVATSSQRAQQRDDPAVGRSGRIFLLPRPTEGTVEEAIDLLLRERYEIGVEDRRPKWVDDFELPREAEPRKAAAEHLEAAEQAIRRYRTAQAEVEQQARFRKLLYETGEDALEPVVRDALRELGASVEDPQRKGREDGRLEYGDHRGMLEIKGRKTPLKLSDVRELDQWVRDALLEWESKGILIACLQKEARPGERQALFSDNCVALAERTGICLMTTTQLYEALRRHQLGELDTDAFFETLFSTAGVCGLPEADDPGPRESEAGADA